VGDVGFECPREVDCVEGEVELDEGRLEGAAEAEGVVRQAEGTAFLVYLEDCGRGTVGIGTAVEEGVVGYFVGAGLSG
jgi:hypothetical protein